jgi:hypothetical protein
MHKQQRVLLFVVSLSINSAQRSSFPVLVSPRVGVIFTELGKQLTNVSFYCFPLLFSKLYIHASHCLTSCLRYLAKYTVDLDIL